MRKLLLLVVTLATLLGVPAVSSAAINDVFDGGVTCAVQGPGDSAGQRWCGTGAHDANANTRSTVASFDGVPIDVNVAFPPEPAVGDDGDFPLVMMFHGYGGGKVNFPGMQRWLNRGYAVFSMTNRGFHESCGTATSQLAAPICLTEGFVRLNDTRYEVRDAQLFAGMLADQGLVQPTKIAASGGSYGGGMSMALAALKNRTMMPDGSLVPWQSPDGTAMSLAVGIPNIPWTDLAYSLVPNGSNIDYIKDASYFGRFGVMKQSYVNGLYISGVGAPGYYSLPGTQPSADLTGWLAFLSQGEPYDGKAQAEQMLAEIQTHHSSYYIDHSVAPAPLLISSGFTDDLFPPNEATRFYNRSRAQYPDSPLGLFFGSFGHMRGQNGPEVSGALNALENTWVDHYLADTGPAPASNVTTYSQACPDEETDPGPFVTDDWASAAPGEIRVEDGGGAQTVEPNGGTPTVAAAFNPVLGGGACADPAGAKEPGTANYELPAAPAGGYMVMGSPTVIAKINLPGENSQIAARLVDVSPDGATKTLVSRGLWRPTQSGFQVFQLTPNGWHVKDGHVLRLELLPKDAGADAASGAVLNYGRPSNGQVAATIEQVDLRIPVRDVPGSAGGLVKAPAKRVLPDRPGVELARGYETTGSETIPEYTDRVTPKDPVIGKASRIGQVIVKGKFLTAKVKCGIGFTSCSKTSLAFKGAPKGKKAKGKKSKTGKGLLIAKGKVLVAKPGQTKKVRLKLTKKARKFFKDKKVRKRGKKKIMRGPNSLRAKVTVGGKAKGFVNVKRVGRVR